MYNCSMCSSFPLIGKETSPYHREAWGDCFGELIEGAHDGGEDEKS